MRDVELYRTILGLTPPGTVVNVDVDVKGQESSVKVEAGPGLFACPECQAEVSGYDRKPRRWRHLDTCQFTTWIEAEVPRVECPSHGVKQIRVPWAEAGSHFTALLERLAIDLLRECSVTGAAGLLRITWDEAWGIKARAVTRGLAGGATRSGRPSAWTRRPSRNGIAISPWSRIWTAAGSGPSRTTGSRRASTASGRP